MVSKKPTALELVQTLRRNGLSNADIARELDRSPRMVSKILRGETSGAMYRSALSQLATTGRLESPPIRRRRKDGTIVRVRAKADAPEKTRIPEDNSGRRTTDKQGGRYRESTTYMPGGDRQHELRIPKGPKAKGRPEANKRIIRMVRSAAQGQSKEKQKRIDLDVTFSDGKRLRIRDYNASSLLRRIHQNAGGDALTWLAEQNRDRTNSGAPTNAPITGITMTVTTSENWPGASRPYKPRDEK